MIAFWYLVYMAAAIMIFILLPFAMFYYESDDEKGLVSPRATHPAKYHT
jgi:hypothetical protein